MTTFGKVAFAVVAIVLVTVIIQFIRFRMASNEASPRTSFVLPKNYFPFDGAYSKNSLGEITKVKI